MNCFNALCPFLPLMWELPEQQHTVIHKMTFPPAHVCQSGREEEKGVTMCVFHSVNQVLFPLRHIHPISLTGAQPMEQMT